MRAIKMNTWEKILSKMIFSWREDELKHIRFGLYLKGLLHLQVIFTSVPLFITILVHILLDNQIDAQKLFVLVNLFNNIGYTMATLFPQGIIAVREGIVTFKRIEAFLMLDEALPFNFSDNASDVSLENVFARWDKTSHRNILINLSITFPRGKLSGIIGSVGSGKTTLLNAILNEAHVSEGRITGNGKISYASQEPWMFPGTIQENIVFGDKFDVIRYNKVIEICALTKDFERLFYGDQTFVGGNGCTLSGGQKTRINLARAVYRDVHVYLLDDPFSSVDVNVGAKIFNECISCFLKGKTVILVTNQLQYLNNIRDIIVLNNGNAELQFKREPEETSFLDFNGVKEDTPSNEDFNRDEIPQMNEENREKGSISWSVYKYFLASCQNYFLLFITAVLFAVSQGFINGTSLFTKLWVNLEQDRVYISKDYFIYIYFGLTLATVVFVIARMLIFYKMCTTSSGNLHTKLLNSVLKAKMDFFETNSSGRILNRFSKDIGVIDELLPGTLFVTCQYALSIVGSIMMISIINPWLTVLSCILVLIFYLLNSRYLLLTLGLKRLEATTKSSILDHFVTTVQGLSTIRVFGVQNLFIKSFDKHQDVHSCTSHLSISTSRAFGFWLDIICVGYIALVTFITVNVDEEKYGGNVGLLLTQSVQLLGHFQLTTRQCSEVENYMTSVERVYEYNSIKHEESRVRTPYESWPDRGEIQFKKVYFQYRDTNSYVLKNLNFTVNPLEKIGIIGRTGAGKSSLVSALFQLAQIEGRIIIDNINIKELDLNMLRSKISIIPQCVMFFPGTIRKNLDPFDLYTDKMLWDVLEQVNLKEIFVNSNLGLDSEMFHDGFDLSIGQKQLICLARAMLSKKKILILDEATANIDTTTDSIIQKIIRDKFADCTVLTIAHRLVTVIDYDKILVLDNGEIVEFDYPRVLLQNPSGLFCQMIHKMNDKTLNELLGKVRNVS
ncbi:hypothetical protein FQA39_LY13532 [Lamprigera yunnana]|nr:hypothetical protein FQA39_LY13532 [Lamprigera yunnana]